MELVELFRLRRLAFWYALVWVILALGTVALAAGGGLQIGAQPLGAGLHERLPAPISAFVGLATFAGLTFASALGLGLNREQNSLSLTWTKPIARAEIALRWLAIDVAALVAAFAVALLMCTLVASAIGALPFVDARLWSASASGCGIVGMWFALTTLLTARLPAWGAGVMGVLWPVAIVLVGIASSPLPSPLTAAVRVVNLLNPLAYGSLVHTGGTSSPLIAVLSDGERTGVTWMLALALAALAVAVWTRREVR